MLEDCRGIVDDDALNLIIHRKKEKAIPVLDRVYCPKPCCNFLMSDRDLIDPRQKKSVERTCVECGLCFCKKCQVPWHYKKTCDEFKKSQSYLTSDAALFESLVKTQGWIKCPQCATVVQKNGGCQRISCRYYWTFVIQTGFLYYLSLTLCFFFIFSQTLQPQVLLRMWGCVYKEENVMQLQPLVRCRLLVNPTRLGF